MSENFAARLGELPTVQWALNGASQVYARAKEISMFTKLGFMAVEVTAKMALLSYKMAYNVSPIPQFVKDKIQENIEIADSLACYGLDEIAKKYPIITQGASICILPAESPAESDKSTVAVWAGDKDQNSTNLIGTMAHVPVQVTRAGLSGVKYMLSTTMSTTGAVLSHIPLVRRVGFERNPPLTLEPVDTDGSSDIESGVSDDDAPICGHCACTQSAKPEEKQQVNGFGKWTAALVGVCLCCCACVCLSVSICACMCLSTLLCGGVCHCLFLGLWIFCR